MGLTYVKVKGIFPRNIKNINLLLLLLFFLGLISKEKIFCFTKINQTKLIGKINIYPKKKLKTFNDKTLLPLGKFYQKFIELQS